MRLMLILLTSLLCANTYALDDEEYDFYETLRLEERERDLNKVDTWHNITPFTGCSDFKAQYTKVKGQYYVRYPADQFSASWIELAAPLKDINDLSVLSERLQSMAQKFCPKEHLSLFGLTSEVACSVNQSDNAPLDQSYISFLEKMIFMLGKTGKNQCDNVYPLLELQNQATQLELDNIIKFRNSASFLKLFTGPNIFKKNENDILIDHFNACGGKDDSNLFVKNTILLELRKQCLFPKPKGLMSLEDAGKIADKISEKYQGQSILDLKEKSGSILRDTIFAYGDFVINDKLKEIISPKYDTKSFTKNLKSYQELKTVPNEKLQDHMTYITKVDAMFEGVEKGIPALLDENITNLLPESWSKKKKNSFIKNKLSPLAYEKFLECTKELRERVKYPSKLPAQKLINHRKKLEKAFCEKNPTDCNAKICEGKKNLFTLRSDITDTDMIKGCSLQAALAIIPTALENVLLGNKDKFEDFFDLTPKIAKDMSSQINKKVIKCIDKKAKKITGIQSSKSIINNVGPLYKINPVDFKKISLACAATAEQEAAGDFVALITNSITALQKIVPSTEGTKPRILYGIKLHKGIDLLTKEAVKNSLPACIEAQKRNGVARPTSLMCQSIIEQEASTLVIEKALGDKLNLYNKSAKSQNILNDFRECSNIAKANALSTLGNKMHETPITSVAESSTFLMRNNYFYDCVSKTTAEAADFISEGEVDKLLADKKSDPLKSKQYIRSLIPQIKKKASDCAKDYLKSNAGTWRKLTIEVKNNGLEKAQKLCTEKVMSEVLPVIADKELTLQLAVLKPIKILNNIESVKNAVAQEIQDEFEVQVSADSVVPHHDSIKLAYMKHIKLPGEDLQTFLIKYAKLTTDTSIRYIQNDILDKIDTSPDPQKRSGDKIKNNISKECLGNLYALYGKELKETIALLPKRDPTKAPPNVKELIIKFLVDGVRYSKGIHGFEENLKTIKKICANPRAYYPISRLQKMKLADPFLMGAVQSSVVQAFKSSTQEQCTEDIKVLNIDFQKALPKDVCTRPHLRSERAALLKELAIKFPYSKDLNLFDMIIHRKGRMLSLIKYKLSDVKTFEALMKKSPSISDILQINYKSIVVRDPETMKMIKKTIITRLFADNSNGSFADRFTKTQVIAGIGLAGLKEASAITKEKVERIMVAKEFVNDVAQEILKEKWTYENVNEYVGWDKTEQNKRKVIINKIFDLRVMPAVMKTKGQKESGPSKIARKEQEEEFTKIIRDHIGSNRIHREEGVAKSLTFAGKFANDMKPRISSKVKGIAIDSATGLYKRARETSITLSSEARKGFSSQYEKTVDWFKELFKEKRETKASPNSP